MNYVAELLQKHEKLWKRMCAHPFLRETAEGTIPDERFANWLRQDYIFVREAVPFLALLIPKAPLAHRKSISETLVGFHQELELFEKMAAQHGVSLSDIAASPTNRGYINFLLATAAIEPYEAGFTVLYTGEKAYLDSWLSVKQMQKSPNKWQAFVDHWTSEAFQQWVDWLGTELDKLSEAASPTLKRLIEERFFDTLRYEIQFWNMAYQGEDWKSL